MTAVVGILNKEAVALAADSAVTIGGSNGRKILNHANKVYRISNRVPIGLMLYNNANLMGTPWEVIIKIFREETQMEVLPSVSDYVELFISFLRKKQFFTNEDIQNRMLTDFMKRVFEVINQHAFNNLRNNNPHKIDNQLFKHQIELLIDGMHDTLISDFESSISDFQDLSKENFLGSIKEIWDHSYQAIYSNNGFVIEESRVDKLKDIIYVYLRNPQHSSKFSHFTGLVFAGYGQDEIFPVLIPIQVSFAWNDRLRYFIEVENKAIISADMYSAIRPFAQTDVINTILAGIDPLLHNFYHDNLGSFLQKYNSLILNTLGPGSEATAERIKNIDINTVLKQLSEDAASFQRQNYINPLMDAVSTLSKDDLAEMAESLIYLTYLKRRITFAEESVGGPVDVAIISKGDGFIWKKRKHYFKPELNPHFFSKYQR